MGIHKRIVLLLVMVCFLLPAYGIKEGSGSVRPVPQPERRVGIAYTLWMDCDMWNDTWGTALLGRYDSRDRRIIRKHAEWLVDAGVDFIWIDWSNQINYDPEELWDGGRQDLIEDATAILFDEYSKLEKHPKISIFIGVTGAPEAAYDGRLQKKADQVYAQYVDNPQYREMWEVHEGKPLLVVYVNTPSPWQDGVPVWDDDRFTVRWMTGYVSEQTNLVTSDRISTFGYWSWEDRGLQTYPVVDDYPEAMVINASTRKQLPSGPYTYIPEKGRRDGRTFRESWARAREIGPKYAMVVSWNEWVTGEQPSAEVSKDIEPSVEFGTLYLDILKEEIKRFKGGAVHEQKSRGTFVDPRDQTTYRYVKIGELWWMAENLAYKPGTGNVWMYDNNEAYLPDFGYLYDWEAANNVCPPDWRMPTIEDWEALIAIAGAEAEHRLKANNGWSSNNGNDHYGFNALPGGIRRIHGDYLNMGDGGFWWSATEYTGNTAFYYCLRNNADQVLSNHIYKKTGLSVRCVRNPAR